MSSVFQINPRQLAAGRRLRWRPHWDRVSVLGVNTILWLPLVLALNVLAR